ncbi:type I restriction-modification enzyme R subunit C-terminal domain-containing protein [uncultured Draconibacterium sp.]|uniref:type I restriction-modification enzyme R subunit C-terminal domain-containing protein n=1 Tax=uncultured Draconibacterium sp. TaxID=1573823 RepID=UPI002AA673BF|nr:type I restriction-modification enzyme R subunit C-terminal domain-containing protein [uncultured Draconibacterium sp.]
MPRVAISVDMMDTGIDVLELVNLVFAKPVYSYTKFWQMIGRGTRLLESTKMKPWCAEKDVFLILDCWDNFEYFKLNPKGKELKAQIPIPVKLFGLRLDKIERAKEIGESAIVSNEIIKLRKQIESLPQNSIVIMEAKNDLQRLDDENFWMLLTSEKLEFLRSVVKPLMRTISGEDFKAMRFEKDVVEISLVGLTDENEKLGTLKEGLVEKISELPLSVNIVAKERDLIMESQTNKFWSTISEDKYDLLIERLSPLMKFIDSRITPLGPAKFDLTDITTKKEFIEFGPQNESVSIAKYREMVEEKVKELTTTNPILQKIQHGKPITEEEATELANELHDENPHITIDLLRRVYNHRKAQFIQFIRHILGIEILESFPETVAKSFDTFIQNHSYLTGRQLQFLDLLKSYILDKGELHKRNLIESPFTMIHPEGIRGVFSPQEINEIIVLTEKLLAA